MFRASSGMSQAYADGAYSALRTTQNASPTTGQTVTMNPTAIDQQLYLTPAGTLLALTVNLPADATSRIGQSAIIATSQAITTLTIGGATTIFNPLANLSAGDCWEFRKVAANTWVRQQ